MIVQPREISDILRRYGSTEVKGNKILSDMRLSLKLNVSEDYLYELMEKEILIPAKPSSSMGGYLIFPLAGLSFSLHLSYSKMENILYCPPYRQ